MYLQTILFFGFIFLNNNVLGDVNMQMEVNDVDQVDALYTSDTKTPSPPDNAVPNSADNIINTETTSKPNKNYVFPEGFNPSETGDQLEELYTQSETETKPPSKVNSETETQSETSKRPTGRRPPKRPVRPHRPVRPSHSSEVVIEDSRPFSNVIEDDSNSVSEDDDDDVINSVELLEGERGGKNSRMVKTLKRNVPSAVKSLLQGYVEVRLKDVKHNLLRCNISFIPTDLRKSYKKCGTAEQGEAIMLLNNLIDHLVRTRDIFISTANKLRECRKLRKEYEASKKTSGEYMSNELLSSDRIKRAADTTPAPSAPPMSNENMGRVTPTKPPNKIQIPTSLGNVLGNAAKRFGIGVQDHWKKYGCYYVTGAEVAIEATTLVMEAALNVYEGFNFVSVMDRRVGICINMATDRFMADKCEDSYIPEEIDNKRK